ncbi:taste receptor type 2 member 9-like [Engystomops pustulosus]|uniref:taste receptor type 2 member 9-like n=1 Tax=Engystomops pustulosus TaxID=76066 RepID=UPI003AFB3428
MAAHFDLEHPFLCLSLVVGTEMISAVGLMTHIFIIAVYVIDWKKTGNMAISDQVIISIVISKISLQIYIQLSLFWEKSCNIEDFLYSFLIDAGYDSAVYSFIWLSTLLSVVYYLKVSKFHNAFLLYLRGQLSKRILPVIFAVFLISIGLSVVNNGIYYKLFSQNSTQLLVPTDIDLDQAGVILLVLFNVIPFFICFMSWFLLITSLCFHVNQMKHNKQSTLSLDVYYRTMQYTTVSVINCAMYVAINILVQDYHCLFSIFIFNFILTALSTFHSIYMICATTKLKKWFSRILRHGKNCLIRRND